MRDLPGYLRTLRNYVHTPKGGHDARDYLRAMAWIFLTILLVVGILHFAVAVS